MSPDLWRQASVTAHEVRALSASWAAYNKGVALGDVFEVATWSNHSTFSQFYVRDCSVLADDMRSIGPFVTAQHVVWEVSEGISLFVFFFPIRPSIPFHRGRPPLSSGYWGGPPVGLLDRPSLWLPSLGRGFRRAAPHGSRGRSRARNPLPVLAPWLPSFVRISPPNITMVFFHQALVGRPADWVIIVPRMVSGVCVLGLLGFGPRPPSVKVTPLLVTYVGPWHRPAWIT
jgi:hypothetical protein